MSTSLDILIPVRPHPAFHGFLPICLESILENVQENIRDIILVGHPDLTLHSSYPFHDKVRFIDEEDARRTIEQKSAVSWSSLGALHPIWMWQQILKLHSYYFSDADHILVVDADLCFLKPVRFRENGKYNFYLENEYHAPYFKTIEQLTGFAKKVESSFIADHLLFDRRILQEMLGFIEGRTGESFLVALNRVLESGVDDQSTNLSEYELYGTYLSHQHPELMGTLEVNPVKGLPHFYMPSASDWSYSKIRETLVHPYPFMPMIAEHKEALEPEPLTVKKLHQWR
ncbi:DUF6492 family protein [Bdellovibrio sp. HCB2-146]|uniref:DUF6492 family protein n=1 Tax=Bdellovibrio sp. HCB2-146 TaxID=3394362 RepID=UPI0039BC8221